jgi:hypothetical protein
VYVDEAKGAPIIKWRDYRIYIGGVELGDLFIDLDFRGATLVTDHAARFSTQARDSHA